MFTTQLLSLFAALSLFGLPSWAKQYSGTLHRSPTGDLEFRTTSPEQRFLLEAREPSVEIPLSKLDSGDFISLFGKLETAGEPLPRLHVQWIEFVGLRNLIGLWANEGQDQFFEFRNFSDLDHYLIHDTQGALEASKKSFYYNIAPAAGAPWKLFLSDEDSVIIGSILFSNENSAALILYPRGKKSNIRFFELNKVKTSSPEHAITR